MNRKIRKIIIIAAALLLAVSLFMVIRQLIDYYMGDKVYSEAMEIAGIQLMETESAVSTESETKAETEEEGGEERWRKEVTLQRSRMSMSCIAS